jgi:hypothetical protein
LEVNFAKFNSLDRIEICATVTSSAKVRILGDVKETKDIEMISNEKLAIVEIYWEEPMNPWQRTPQSSAS